MGFLQTCGNPRPANACIFRESAGAYFARGSHHVLIIFGEQRRTLHGPQPPFSRIHLYLPRYSPVIFRRIFLTHRVRLITFDTALEPVLGRRIKRDTPLNSARIHELFSPCNFPPISAPALVHRMRALPMDIVWQFPQRLSFAAMIARLPSHC